MLGTDLPHLALTLDRGIAHVPSGDRSDAGFAQARGDDLAASPKPIKQNASFVSVIVRVAFVLADHDRIGI